MSFLWTVSPSQPSNAMSSPSREEKLSGTEEPGEREEEGEEPDFLGNTPPFFWGLRRKVMYINTNTHTAQVTQTLMHSLGKKDYFHTCHLAVYTLP